jgi:hypothetical protein
MFCVQSVGPRGLFNLLASLEFSCRVRRFVKAIIVGVNLFLVFFSVESWQWLFKVCKNFF